MKLFIADIKNVKDKLTAAGFSNQAVKSIITILHENNHPEQQEKEGDAKSKAEKFFKKEFECNFECRAGSEAFNLEQKLQQIFEKGLRKIFAWLTPFYAFGIGMVFVLAKPYIDKAWDSIYCNLKCYEPFKDFMLYLGNIL